MTTFPQVFAVRFARISDEWRMDTKKGYKSPRLRTRAMLAAPSPDSLQTSLKNRHPSTVAF